LGTLAGFYCISVSGYDGLPVVFVTQYCRVVSLLVPTVSQLDIRTQPSTKLSTLQERVIFFSKTFVFSHNALKRFPNVNTSIRFGLIEFISKILEGLTE